MSWFKDALNTVNDAASSVANTVSDTASDALNTVSDAASSVANTVSDTVSDALNTVSDAASSVANTDWMGKIYSIIQNRRLNEIVIPGTHDSGCYEFDSVSIKTQEKSIAEQLSFGVRYFDLRFICLPTGYHIHHGLAKSLVVTLNNILKPLKEFLENFPKEIVVLHITHWENFTQKDYENFLSEVRTYLGAWIAKRSNAEVLPTIKEMVETNQRIIISSDFPYNNTNNGTNDSISNFIKDFVWDNIDSPYKESIYQSGDPSKIIDYLSEQINEKGNKNLWVLQGVMTLSTSQTVGGGIPLVGDVINFLGPDVSIKTYAKKLNPILNNYLCSDTWRGKYNIFICDFVTDDLINTAIKLNSNLGDA
jgi:hypothetical protein